MKNLLITSCIVIVSYAEMAFSMVRGAPDTPRINESQSWMYEVRRTDNQNDYLNEETTSYTFHPDGDEMVLSVQALRDAFSDSLNLSNLVSLTVCGKI